MSFEMPRRSKAKDRKPVVQSRSIVQKIGRYQPEVIAAALRVASPSAFHQGEFVLAFWPKARPRKLLALNRPAAGMLHAMTDAGLLETAKTGGYRVTPIGREYVAGYDDAVRIVGAAKVRKFATIRVTVDGRVIRKAKRRTKRAAKVETVSARMRRHAKQIAKPTAEVKRKPRRRNAK